MSNEKLLNGQAMSIQWVAFALTQINKDINANSGEITKSLLDRAKSIGGENDYKALEVGCSYVANFILPFAIELELKSLLIKEKKEYGKIHSLKDLYDKLPEIKRNKIENKYCEMSESSSKNVEQILSNHNNDFVQWRYLEEPIQLNNNIRDLQFVLCAIIEIYEDE